MKQNKAINFILFLTVLGVLSGCSATTQSLLKMPFFSLEVLVVDEEQNPLSGAVVQVVNGEQGITDTEGNASVKTGSMGAYTVRVTSPDRISATFHVTMPMDRGMKRTIKLAKVLDDINININANIGGGAVFGNMFGGMLMNRLYPLMFQSLFVAYGYNLEIIPYREGEWTEWVVNSEKNKKASPAMRKAFLKKMENGQEWWQIIILGKKPEDRIVMEVLFNTNKQAIRRMRQKKGDEKAKEVPVTEGWYSAPVELTPESLEGSVVSKGVSVDVPAGTFSGDLMEWGVGGSEGALRMWRIKKVPGGVVRAERKNREDKVDWSTVLNAYGKDAKTELGSY